MTEPLGEAAPSPASAVEREMLRVRGLLEQGRYEESLNGASALLARVPENRDAWYLLAVSQRFLRRVPEALATLAHFERLHPEYSRLHQERGHCHVALRQAEPAIAAFLRAVNLNAALPASWSALRTLFGMTGRDEEARMAAAHVEALSRQPPEIVTASSMLADGELHPAERLLRAYLLEHGDHVEAMRLLAKIGMKLEVLDDAELLLEGVLTLAPDYDAARHDFAQVLLQRHQHSRALEELERLLAKDPANRAYRISRAAACVGLGRHEEAIDVYRALLAETPRAADLHLSVAHALKTLGRQAAAIEEYRTAIDCRPGYGDAYWSLANLKTYRFADADVAGMREAEAAPDARADDRWHLCFALGKALEDRGEYAESFRYYQRGNALKRAGLAFSIEPIERNARLQASVCTREFFAARRGHGSPAEDPIFIVGLPRAGSTLLEQILASHSQVEGTMELPHILQIVAELQGREPDPQNPRYPANLAELSAAACRELGERYLAGTRLYRTGRPRFVDKMPNNFRHVGLIHLILPQARIIDARREPMACCFGNFKQLFASGQEFTYGIEDLARYYRSYVQLMRHWDEVLPGRVLRVQHETVVEDLESAVRRLLAFCGLDYEPGCLAFHENSRSVRTASSEQVRRPIFTEGLHQWRHFAPWLGGLEAALGPDR